MELFYWQTHYNADRELVAVNGNERSVCSLLQGILYTVEAECGKLI